MASAEPADHFVDQTTWELLSLLDRVGRRKERVLVMEVNNGNAGPSAVLMDFAQGLFCRDDTRAKQQQAERKEEEVKEVEKLQPRLVFMLWQAAVLKQLTRWDHLDEALCNVRNLLPSLPQVLVLVMIHPDSREELHQAVGALRRMQCLLDGALQLVVETAVYSPGQPGGILEAKRAACRALREVLNCHEETKLSRSAAYRLPPPVTGLSQDGGRSSAVLRAGPHGSEEARGPHKKKKPFIEKKKAVTFHLVHRSQRDPLAADDTAPQRVLLPTQKGHEEQRREEQRKYGVFFDDDYDYLQHLREASGPSELVPAVHGQQSRIVVTSEGHIEDEVQRISAPSIKLPSSVFATEFEEDVGLLNKAAPVSGPRLDFDPDIVAALDDDFDFDNPENILEDDFVLQANEPQKRGSGTEDEDEWEDVEDDSDEKDSCSNDKDYDSEGPLSDDGFNGQTKEFLFMQEETRSRFTEYSMTSSVMRRNEQLTLLDDRFEKFFEQFDEDEIGALDNVELEGYINTDNTRLQEVLNDYYKEKAKNCVKLDALEPCEELDSAVNEESEEEKEEIVAVVIEEPKEKWDCESILSTYSNLYNHPTLIKEPSKPKQIKVSHKTGIPLHILPQKGPTAKQIERMQMINDSDLPRASTQPRSKDESKEDRKARKQAIKEERKERRMEKKANKLAFKLEKTRQEKEILNVKQNLQGLKLS
ncbi:protein LTV1 homolog [Aegotheles albertisi]